MYPREQLTYLAERKVLLQARIARQRIETGRNLERVIRPIVWAENLRARWRALPPAVRLFSGPVGLLLQGYLRRRLRFGGKLLVWGPVAWRAWKWLSPFLTKPPRRRAA